MTQRSNILMVEYQVLPMADGYVKWIQARATECSPEVTLIEDDLLPHQCFSAEDQQKKQICR